MTYSELLTKRNGYDDGDMALPEAATILEAPTETAALSLEGDTMPDMSWVDASAHLEQAQQKAIDAKAAFRAACAEFEVLSDESHSFTSTVIRRLQTSSNGTTLNTATFAEEVMTEIDPVTEHDRLLLQQITAVILRMQATEGSLDEAERVLRSLAA